MGRQSKLHLTDYGSRSPTAKCKCIEKNDKGDHVEVSFADRLANAKVVAFYFSAHWCPPCRGFTPELKKSSKDWTAAGCEIIFVTSDQNDKAFKEYYAEMGEHWLSYPFGDDQIKALKEKFNIAGIPSLIVVDKDGKIIDDSGRATVMNKKEKAVED